MNLAAGLIVADRFRLVSPLGQGGMGSVWAARHLGLDIPCAVKFIHADEARSPKTRIRFEREARAAAQIQSPHVVHLYDHGVWQDMPYIAMELMEGEDLRHRLQRRGRLSPQETLAILTDVGHALSKAHALGLVHRDLKPDNIFLARGDEHEVAKVLDFGIVHDQAHPSSTTETGALMGTPHYMSPEQAREIKDLNHLADLWALAVIAFQCLTGVLPFDGKPLAKLMMKIIMEPLPVPSASAPVPRGFDAWWARAASRDRLQRFQSVREFVDGLGIALGLGAPGTSESSRPPPHSVADPARSAPRSLHGTMLLATSPALAPAPLTPAATWRPAAAPEVPLPASSPTSAAFHRGPLRRAFWGMGFAVALIGLVGGVAAFLVLRQTPGLVSSLRDPLLPRGSMSAPIVPTAEPPPSAGRTPDSVALPAPDAGVLDAGPHPLEQPSTSKSADPPAPSSTPSASAAPAPSTARPIRRRPREWWY